MLQVGQPMPEGLLLSQAWSTCSRLSTRLARQAHAETLRQLTYTHSCLPLSPLPTMQAEVGSRALTEGCVLVLEDRTPIGCIEEIFGPGEPHLWLALFTFVHSRRHNGQPQGHQMPMGCLPGGRTVRFGALLLDPFSCICSVGPTAAPCTALGCTVRVFQPQLAARKHPPGSSSLPLPARSDEPVLRAALRWAAAHAVQPGTRGRCV